MIIYDDKTICIGKKDMLIYASSIVIWFEKLKFQEVRVLSRGKFTSKAIDACQLVVNNFLHGKVYVKNVTLGSDEFETNNKKIRVSTIEIILSKMEV